MTQAPSFGDGDQRPQRIEPTALESIQRAEFDVQISTAKRYPRQLGKVKQDMMSFATLDQETAESCFYTLPRGGKNIQGPSVRLAEIAVSCFGNLRVGSRVISTVTDGLNPHVVIQSICHDLEKNVAVTMEKRRRITKKKSKEYIDEDDINLACNAGAAIAFRDAVFKVVPMALVKPVYEQAKMVAIGDAKTLVDRRGRMVLAFGKMGVTVPMILEKLAKKTLDDVDLGDLETLIGLHTALKDGDTTIDEIFSQPKAAKPVFEAPSIPAQGVVQTVPTPPAPEVAANIERAKAIDAEVEAGLAPVPEAAPAKWEPLPAEPPQPLPADPNPGPRRTVRAKAGPVQQPPGAKERFLEAGVSFDDFTDWCVTTGRAPNAKEWFKQAARQVEAGGDPLTLGGEYSFVPDAFWKALETDHIGVGKAITLYSTKQS